MYYHYYNYYFRLLLNHSISTELLRIRLGLPKWTFRNWRGELFTGWMARCQGMHWQSIRTI